MEPPISYYGVVKYDAVVKRAGVDGDRRYDARRT
jgi:hypothetical protein